MNHYAHWGRAATLIALALTTDASAHPATHASDNATPATSRRADVAHYAIPADAAELKFRDFFQLPVGPKGLMPTEKLLSLNGKRVRIAGYMAEPAEPVAGQFILSPVPVSMGDEDESMVDDLPASVVFVHLAPSQTKPIPFRPGILRLYGTLEVGNAEEADGRVSTVRLLLAPPLSKLLTAQPARRQTRSE